MYSSVYIILDTQFIRLTDVLLYVGNEYAPPRRSLCRLCNRIKNVQDREESSGLSKLTK